MVRKVGDKKQKGSNKYQNYACYYYLGLYDFHKAETTNGIMEFSHKNGIFTNINVKVFTRACENKSSV